MQKSPRVIQILEGYESLLEGTYLIPVPTEIVEEKYISGKKILESAADLSLHCFLYIQCFS